MATRSLSSTEECQCYMMQYVELRLADNELTTVLWYHSPLHGNANKQLFNNLSPSMFKTKHTHRSIIQPWYWSTWCNYSTQRVDTSKAFEINTDHRRTTESLQAAWAMLVGGITDQLSQNMNACGIKILETISLPPPTTLRCHCGLCAKCIETLVISFQSYFQEECLCGMDNDS